MTGEARELARYLGRWALGVAVLLVGAAWASVRVDGVVVGTAALTLAVAWWLANRPAAVPPAWEPPPTPLVEQPPAAQPDARALAHLLDLAQPGRGFSTRRVAEELAALAGSAPGGPPDARLSPALHRYLATLSDPAAVPPVLTRRELRAHLKELEDL